MGELVTVKPSEALPIPAEVAAEMQQMREALQTMAGLLRTTNETMAQLQRQVRLLEKVTPAQASALNKAIRERAAQLCDLYAARGCDKPVAAAIRKAVKPQVQGWDDYKTMKEIKGRAKA